MTKAPQFARKCIFCGANANSREHLYSMWMHGLLPEFPQQTYSGEFIEEHPKTRVVSKRTKRTKPGHIHTKKIKAVCTGCNNGWMSVIESDAKPFLERLIKGEFVVLDEGSLLIVARWASLKAIVSEHDQPENRVTPQADRTNFMRDGKIPPYFNLYILSHKCASRSGYVRTSHTASLTKDGPVPPLDGRLKNTQQISVILGSIMLHVNAARVDNFRIEDRLSMPAVEALRIWPINRTRIAWAGGAGPYLRSNARRGIFNGAHCRAAPGPLDRSTAAKRDLATGAAWNPAEYLKGPGGAFPPGLSVRSIRWRRRFRRRRKYLHFPASRFLPEAVRWLHPPCLRRDRDESSLPPALWHGFNLRLSL